MGARFNGGIIGVNNFIELRPKIRITGVFNSQAAETRIRSQRWPFFYGGFKPWTPTNLQTNANWAQFSAELTALRANTVVTDTLSTPAGTYPGSYAYYGGVLLPDGRVFCVPYDATSARIYDPVTDTLSTPAGTYPGGDAYVGGVLLPDGRVFCVPYNATSARIYGAEVSTAPLSTNLVTSPYFNKL